MRPVLRGLAAGVRRVPRQPRIRTTGPGAGLRRVADRLGSPERVTGEHSIEPDFGVSWIQPGVKFGSFEAEIRGTRRADRLHVGRNYAALRDLRTGGFRWTFEAGDAFLNRGVNHYGFSNLSTPALTVQRRRDHAREPAQHRERDGGQGHGVAQHFRHRPRHARADARHPPARLYRPTDRLDLVTRVSRFRTSDLREFSFTIADSDQVAGGARFQVSPPSIWSATRHSSGTGAATEHAVPDYSYLAGTNVLLPRGWIQFNVARFSPGDFPAMNDPLQDRESAFLAAEYDVWSSVRVFGGVDAIKTNINPDLHRVPRCGIAARVGTRAFAACSSASGGPSMLTIASRKGTA